MWPLQIGQISRIDQFFKTLKHMYSMIQCKMSSQGRHCLLQILCKGYIRPCKFHLARQQNHPNPLFQPLNFKWRLAAFLRITATFWNVRWTSYAHNGSYPEIITHQSSFAHRTDIPMFFKMTNIDQYLYDLRYIPDKFFSVLAVLHKRIFVVFSVTHSTITQPGLEH